MSLKLQTMLAIFASILGIGILIYWFFHDSLTGMQLFKELWLPYIIVAIIYLILTFND
jgi:hypothetical protein